LFTNLKELADHLKDTWTFGGKSVSQNLEDNSFGNINQQQLLKLKIKLDCEDDYMPFFEERQDFLRTLTMVTDYINEVNTHDPR